MLAGKVAQWEKKWLSNHGTWVQISRTCVKLGLVTVNCNQCSCGEKWVADMGIHEAHRLAPSEHNRRIARGPCFQQGGKLPSDLNMCSVACIPSHEEYAQTHTYIHTINTHIHIHTPHIYHFPVKDKKMKKMFQVITMKPCVLANE